MIEYQGVSVNLYTIVLVLLAIALLIFIVRR